MASINTSTQKSIGWTESASSIEIPPPSESSSDENGRHSHAKLSLFVASVFIVGEMAGSGILTLPISVAGAGWAGVAVIVICCFASGQAAVYLGKSWCMIENRWPEYKAVQADPYSVIGLKSFGRKTEVLVSLSVLVQLYGVGVVFMKLCADLVHQLVKDHLNLTQVSDCDWLIIVGFISLPLMWLPSPSEISFIAYTAMSCTAISCVLIIIAFIQEGMMLTEPPPSPTVTFESFFLSLGTIAFAYGGAATFPTFQNYMKAKSKFPIAVYIGFTLLLVLYLPVAIGGFALYGGNVKRNILDNLPPSGLRTSIDVLMAFHVFAALLIVINPVNLSFEETLGLRAKGISLGKCLMRTFVCLSMIVVGLTIPEFGKILNLVGAATVSTTSFMFPPIFYLRLTKLIRSEDPENASGQITIWTKGVCILIALLGLIGGAIGTYIALSDIGSPEAFTKPCYA